MKLKLIWEFFLSCNSFIQFVLIFEFFEFMVVFIGFLYFYLVYYNHSMILKFMSYFKQLPIYNKILTIWFSVIFAIPNKIFVNNGLNKFVITFSIFLVVIISHVFVPFILLYIMFWVLVLESYFFAVAYENNISFRNVINNNLFNGNSQFAKEYFNFFWGNMRSGGSGASKAGVVGSILSGLYSIARNNEKTHVRVQGHIETQSYLNNAASKPETPLDVMALHIKTENRVFERDTIILKTEKRAQELASKALEWCQSRGHQDAEIAEGTAAPNQIVRQLSARESTPRGRQAYGVEPAASVTLVRGWRAWSETKVSKLHRPTCLRGEDAMEGTSGYAPRFSFRDEARRATLRRARPRSSMFDQLIPRRRATAPSFGPPFQTDANISW